WRGKKVDVLRVGPAVDCDGEADFWFEVRLGDRRGWLPGCLMKPVKGAGFVLVARHPKRPTYRVLPPAPASPDGGAPVPVGFVPESAVADDDTLVGVRAVDDRTLEVELEQPTPWFIDLTGHPTLYPVRRDVIEAFDKRGEPDLWTRPESMISNGPYMLDQWKFRYEITMKVNPYYRHAKELAIRHIVWLEVEEYRATLSLYKTGEIDTIGDNLSIPPEFMPIAEKKKDFFRADYLSVYWYECNTRKKPLDDARVRHALDLAIDKAELIRAVTRAGQTPATHYVPEYTGLGYSDQVAADRAAGTDPFHGPGHDYDPERARALLKDAGYDVVKDGAGYRAVGMPNVEILYNTNEAHRAIAVAVQDMWKHNLGVSVTLRNEEWRVMLKNYRDGNFQIMRYGQVADYNHPNTFLESFLSGNPQNQSGWGSTAFDETMRRAAAEPDPKASIRLYRDAEKIAVDGMPRIPLYFYTKSNIVKPYVNGYYASPRNVHLVEYLSIDPNWRTSSTNAPSHPPEELPKPGRLAPEAP
ncbi:MAG TPA: peptide ABC transporter substrate-binding protein, partial [Minicystis sp.]|nr:peptide ABC transporter substrate-binding protein [Minicystis sp.]